MAFNYVTSELYLKVSKHYSTCELRRLAVVTGLHINIFEPLGEKCL